MIKLLILGGGNVAHHLARVFINATNVSLIQVFNRSIKSIKNLEKFVEITDDYRKLKKADIYIISVSDTAIEKVSSNIKMDDALVVHTSGSTALAILKKHKRIGVFYPLQTFSKDRNINFSEIPICIEASNNGAIELLEQLAESISESIYKIDSIQRKQLHIAAVFVNNFVNHLYTIGDDICKEHNIQTDILRPLIKETAKKVESMNAFDAQTGPARRGDSSIIKKHISNLNKNQQDIYKLLSNSITVKYGKKL